jgi:hypothetical protein
MRFDLKAIWVLIALSAVVGRAVRAQSGANQFPPFQWFGPGACAVSPKLIEHLATRDNPDSSAYSPSKDVTSHLVADSAGVCSNVFGASTEDEWELLNLSRVELIQGLDAEAKATAQRYLSSPSASTPQRRAWAYYLIIADNLAARPARIASAQEILTRLDALGPAAAKLRLLAHLKMANAAEHNWDDATTTSQADAAIAAWKLLPRLEGIALAAYLAQCYLIKGEIAARTQGGSAVRAVLDTARRVVPAQAQRPHAMIERAAGMYDMIDKPAPPITAKFWFNALELQVTRPAKGKVSIVSTAAHYCGSACIPRYLGLGRFASRFGDRGLEIINVTMTFGFYGDSAPKTPLEEAKYDSAYFLGKVKLPGLLAVHETEVSWLRDGRRRNHPSPQEDAYHNASFVIIDKRGIIRYLGDWESILEEPVAKLIEKLLAET